MMNQHRSKVGTSNSYVLDVRLTTEQLESFYAGSVSQVVARDRQGTRVQFPLSSLRPFVGHMGVRGTFVLQVDDDNRLVSLRKQ